MRAAGARKAVSGVPCAVRWSAIATTGRQNATMNLRDEIGQILRHEVMRRDRSI